ncbi:pectinesterase family protein [Flavobacterium hibernum]|uniref:Pectinesterase n=1 Tax=Flavobacterium hibernum TaxID=37752 RepID=A0A0D0EVG3_9FLAO|nr:pectinesterase family protein [Flavobacterium hibernum]KIO50891.1 pectin esterase [Flavobacterium hibernum]OXA90192.1 pectin esterase [Flavobacterium hibernum]STO18621.1 Pectinesterase A precursor [Flavobacterium hibernum]
MKSALALLLFLTTMFLSAQTLDNKFALTVAQDGSGDFKTIQEAVNNVKDSLNKRTVITIRPGVYVEKLVIPATKTFITLKGLDRDKTIISFDDYSGKPVREIDASGKKEFGTSTSYSFLILGNDCTLENLTVENTAGRVGQAVALHIKSDRVIVKNCNILGNQDTLYLSEGNTRTYFENCFINGTTDFIFGAATAYFYKCTIESLTNSYITAASTPQGQPYGFVFTDCKLTAKENTVDKVFLGRPWRPYAQTVFINTEMGSHIIPEGWNEWIDKRFPDKDKTAYYAEYGSKGAGAKDLSKRVKWSYQLEKSALKKYKIEKVFNDWNPNK